MTFELRCSADTDIFHHQHQPSTLSEFLVKRLCTTYFLLVLLVVLQVPIVSRAVSLPPASSSVDPGHESPTPAAIFWCGQTRGTTFLAHLVVSG